MFAVEVTTGIWKNEINLAVFVAKNWMTLMDCVLYPIVSAQEIDRSMWRSE